MPDNNQDNNQFKQVAQEIYLKNLELHKDRKHAEQLLYRVSEGVYATDEHCKITLLNHALEELLQVKAEDMIGKDASEVITLFNEDGTPIDTMQYCKLEVDTVDIPNVAILKCPSGNHYVHVKVSAIEGEEKEFLVTMSDVTKEKQLEKAKDEFISITSHELRTPMSIIKSYLWMLGEGKGGKLTEKQMEYVTKARTGTERMLALINDILNVSRVEQGKIEFNIEKINLNDLLQTATEELSIKANEKKLYLKWENTDKIKFAYADKQKMQEVITNLVGNAVKFTDTGGITISVTKDSDEFVKITVTDTGRGIKEEDIVSLFHKFQRLDNSYQTIAEAGGTGLGLYIVKLYIGQMGGKVGVLSDGPGKGSSFWITLPINKPTNQKADQ